jgi:hypothetical protein
MTRRQLVYAGIAFLWFIALGIVAKVSLDHLPVEPWGNPAGDKLSVPVTGDTRVGQTFVAPMPGLYRIEVTLERDAPSNSRPITLHLRGDLSADEDLWASTMSTAEVQKGTAFSLEFPVLRDSKGKTYYFFLDSPGSDAKDAVAVRYSPTTFLAGATAYVNAQPVAGDLQFHTYYSLRTRDRLDLLLTHLAEGRPYMLGTKGCYVGLGLVYALVLCAFLFQVARAILTDQAEGS